MQDMQDMIERLNHSGRKLSKGHRRIAQYIVEHYDKAVFMTASRLGESVGVSESTVVRFAAVQRFEMSSEIDPNAVLRTVLKSDMQNIRATVEELDNHAFEEGVKRILNAKEIYVIGLRSAAPLAQFLGYYLNYIFDRVHLVSSAATDVFEEIARISEADVVIGISFPRYSTRTVEAMRFARSCGAQVISITDGPICLNACTDMASFVDSLAAPMSVINALVVSLGLHRKEELSRHFKQLEAIWAANDVYLGETDEQKT